MYISVPLDSVTDTQCEMALSYQFITEGKPGSVSVGKFSTGIHVSWHIESLPLDKWLLAPHSLLRTDLRNFPSATLKLKETQRCRLAKCLTRTGNQFGELPEVFLQVDKECSYERSKIR